MSEKMKKSIKWLLPLIAIVSLAAGSLVGMLVFGGTADTGLTAVTIEAKPAKEADYDFSYTPDILTSNYYGDNRKVMTELTKLQSLVKEGKAAKDDTVSALTSAFSELGAFSLYYTYDGDITREIDGVRYGAYVNEGEDPIGGGVGYSEIFTTGDYVVDTVDELLDALGKAKSGEVIFIEGHARIDVSGITPLTLGEGVTLASDRGRALEDGSYSTGAKIFGASLEISSMIFASDNSRLSGLVIDGRNPYTHAAHHSRSFGGDWSSFYGTSYYSLRSVNFEGIKAGSNVRVDNCEISGFGHAAIHIAPNSKDVTVDHCYIHHNQTNGLGYGICHNDASTSVVEYCLFNYNRHSIAATGSPTTGYIARYNIEMGESLSHCFDIHGGNDRGDGTDIAGTYCEMYNNTFLSKKYPYWLRGVPEDYQIFYNNICVEPLESYSRELLVNERATLYDNIFGGELEK